MTCAKVRVRAVLFTQNRGLYIGENLCDWPMKECPRCDGEGYDKCKTVCKQPLHAEMHALKQCKDAGDDPTDGIMFVKYKYICDGCKQVMREHNIESVVCDFSS